MNPIQSIGADKEISIEDNEGGAHDPEATDGEEEKPTKKSQEKKETAAAKKASAVEKVTRQEEDNSHDYTDSRLSLPC